MKNNLPCILIALATCTVALVNGWTSQQRCNAQPLTCDTSELLTELSLLRDDTQQSFDSQMQIIQQLQQEIRNLKDGLIPIGTSPSNPASNCIEILQRDGSATTGSYWLTSEGAIFQVTCDFDVQLPPPSPVRGWQEIVSMDLSNAADSCPSPLVETTTPSRRCQKSTDIAGCESVFFSTNRVPFTKLCGRAVGYSVGTVDTFASVFGVCGSSGCQSIDEPYVDGISFTYSTDNNGRSHIWSLAAQDTFDVTRCPCGEGATHLSPSFVGDDYYCEVTNSISSPLWEGVGCGDVYAPSAPCCDNPNLPWFCREFDQPVVTDNIEMRVCTDEAGTNEAIFFDLLKIYIQ